jgi:3-mercaptopyruvate sulfurtransferase SseA
VIFTCQWGVSACQGYFAFKQALYNYEQRVSMKDYSNVKLERNYQISVYDGSYEEYKLLSNPDKKVTKQNEELDKEDDECVIF